MCFFFLCLQFQNKIFNLALWNSSSGLTYSESLHNLLSNSIQSWKFTFLNSKTFPVFFSNCKNPDIMMVVCLLLVLFLSSSELVRPIQTSFLGPRRNLTKYNCIEKMKMCPFCGPKFYGANLRWKRANPLLKDRIQKCIYSAYLCDWKTAQSWWSPLQNPVPGEKEINQLWKMTNLKKCLIITAL